MECQSCHTANPDSNRYCENCGRALTYKCAACGFDCTPAAKFCGGCGTALTRTPTPAGPASQTGASAASLEPATGWGELKQATVLFADIVSSTEQIAQLDPEEAMDRLKPAVLLMCEAVERFGGTVMRTLGDGVMALFGVPRALEGHARLACESALHMQSLFAGNPQGFSIRVGLHSGLIASDPHAHDSGKGGGAHGLTIHLASRVIGLAPAGGITMTADCHSMVRGSVDVESIGHPALKGIAEPVEIFRLVGLNPAFASQHFHQAKLTPFRGRDKELTLLQQAQRLAEARDAQVIGISGGPGTGKSRLCYEFAQWCRTRGRPVYEVRAQLYGSATPLQPVLELLRTFFFAISSADSAAAARARIAARLEGLGTAQPGDLALLSDFLGVPDNDSSAPVALNAKARRARLLAIVGALVKDSADVISVILIEDMHWLDEASEEFVATLVKAVAHTRTMVILNYRSSYRSPWVGFENFQEIEVGELSAADTDALVRELISHRREFQEVSQLIVRRSGGNPFFAEELVRSLAERGVLSGDPSHSQNGLESIERALPATVQAVIGARIDRLSEAEKSVLQMCAIIGKEVPLAVLERVAGTMRAQIDRALDALCHAELIQPQPASGGRRFAFGHPLIQEVAYGTQLKAKRAAIHASVASAMEHFYADQLDEYSGLIAHHYEAAGQPENAADYAARAAHWLSGTDSAQAIKHWHKVRDLLAGRAGTAQGDRLRAMACSQISLLGWREGLSLQEVQPFIEEGMELAGKVDPRLVQFLLIIEGRMSQASGAPADWYIEKVTQALAMTDLGKDPGRAATLNAALSQAYGWAGLLEKALAANDVAVEHAHRIDSFDHRFMGFNIEHWALGMRGRLLARLGRFDEANEQLGKLIALGDNLIDPVLRQIAHYTFVDLAWCNNDAALAQVHSSVVSEIADKHRSPYMRVFAASSRAMTLSIAGDFEAAAVTFSEALETIRGSNVSLELESEILANLAECHRRLGNTELALVLAGEAIEVSRQRSTRLAECRALISHAGALIDGRDAQVLERAKALLDEAAALIVLTGARTYGAPLSVEQQRLREWAGSRQESMTP
jgi:class 3 adenylate cyclase/tetratricopeptide (TPR) repeat protein